MAERSHSYRTKAVILRRRNYGDADRILTVFTPRLGKRILIAKGSRKTTSRKAGHLELFNHVNLLVAQARTWDIITESETIEGFLQLRGDLDAISRAAYICELVDAFTAEDDEYEPVWQLLLFCLRELDEGSANEADLLTRWFELQLLRHMGFQPELFACLGCGGDLLPVENFIHLNAGGVFCPECGRNMQGAEPISARILKILRHLFRTHWDGLRGLHIRPSTGHAVEGVLQRYLVTITERRLRSTDFIHRLRQTVAERESVVEPEDSADASSQSLGPPVSRNSSRRAD